jgi:hypothetical protein
MKEKPVVFLYLSFFFFVIALSLPMQIMWIYGHDLTEINAVLSKLTALNIVCFILLLVNSWFSFSVSALLNITLPGLAVAISLNNYTVGLYGSDFTAEETLFASLSFVSVILGFYVAGGYQVLKNPRLWWWKTPKRKSMKRPLALWKASGRFIIGDTENLSSSGVFVNFSESSRRKQKNFFRGPRPGESFEIHIQTRKRDCVSLKGTVVREEKNKRGEQLGVGIRFNSMGLLDRVKLMSLLYVSRPAFIKSM